MEGRDGWGGNFVFVSCFSPLKEQVLGQCLTQQEDAVSVHVEDTCMGLRGESGAWGSTIHAEERTK